MDHLFLPGRADAMDVDPAALHDVEALRGRAFVEEILALGDLLRDGEGGDRRNIGRGQPEKELTAPQRVLDHELFEFSALQ